MSTVIESPAEARNALSRSDYQVYPKQRLYIAIAVGELLPPE
jgi:hypothetical protein